MLKLFTGGGMKRYIKTTGVALLTIILSFFLISCGKTVEVKWQERYGLGMRYLSEENYEEAILAFNAAIEIDNKKPDAYIGLQKVYLRTDNPIDALKILYKALETTEDKAVQEELDTFYNRYTFICKELAGGDIISTDNLFTLECQEDMHFDNEKHTINEIVLHDDELGTDYLVTAIDLKSEGYWEFSEDDFRVVTQHDDKLLINVWYGPGGTVTFIYSILDNTIKELNKIGKLTGYDQAYLDGSEDFIFGTSLTYDVESEQSLYWYDWDGNKIYNVENTGGCMFFNNKLYYSLWTLRQDISYQSVNFYDYYIADLDGQNAEYIGSIKYKDNDFGLYAYFWYDGLIQYEYRDIDGERKEKQIHVDELKMQTIIP